MTKAEDTRKARALSKVAGARSKLDRATVEKTAATKALNEAMIAARDVGLKAVEIATVAGVSPERVTQVAPAIKAPAPRAHAQKDVPVDSRVTVDADVPTLAGHGLAEGRGLSGIVSTRKRRPYGKVTVFYRDGIGRVVSEGDGRAIYLGYPDANSVAGILRTVEQNLPDVAEVRVYLTGETPAVTNGNATKAEAVREWALELGAAADAWRSTSHYLADPALPVLRFRNDGTSQSVTIMRAASWWGETEADVDTCADAWRGLAAALERDRIFAGAGLADTPATTGRALWLRTIPEGRSFPVMSTELRELIAATSGQGRVELLEPVDGRDVGQFTYMDGRFMYASLCWGLPIGEPVFWTGDQLDKLDAREWTRLVRGRGRWRITMTVPASWSHVGLFMAPAAGGGWRYPSRPGETFTTWVDGHELWNATTHGWDPVVHEGFSWAEGKPLDLWVRKMLDIWKSAEAHKDNSAAQLAARAVRSIVLYAIGAFATRAHDVTKTAPVDGPAPDVPAGVEVRRVGEQLTWQEPGKLSGWTEETSHPEWSAAVWARARVRLLDGAGVRNVRVGALHLPREQVVAFATDAIYLATDPGWEDDHAPGRFRVKGRCTGPATWPSTMTELHTLRDKSEKEVGR